MLSAWLNKTFPSWLWTACSSVKENSTLPRNEPYNLHVWSDYRGSQGSNWFMGNSYCTNLHSLCLSVFFFLSFFFFLLSLFRARCSSMVRAFVHGAMGRRIDPSWWTHWAISRSSQCYSVCGMVHIKEPLLLIGKSGPCGGSGFPLSLSEWSFTICLKEGNVLFNDALNTFYLGLYGSQTYG